MTGKALPRTVIVLGLASFLTDVSSEMIYPLLPAFLATVLGATALSLGLIEGVAETTASLVKVYSGRLSDRLGRKKPLILAGYGLSSVARPLIGLAFAWPAVLLLRFLDRVGKGIRTSPRDALIAEVTPAGQRGRAFGLHRSMDHAGSVIGPLVAAALLQLGGFALRDVFLLAAIPAALTVVVLAFGIKDPPPAVRPDAAAAGPRGFALLKDWRRLNPELKGVLGCVLLFTLGNSTDAFLLLMLSDAGIPAGWIGTLWALLHVVKMVGSYGFGRLSDRLGHRPMILAGWVVYAAVYAGFAVAREPSTLIAIFLAYGIFYGLTEPSERAIVAGAATPDLRGTAFGLFHLTVGLGALPASLLFGFLWKVVSPAAAFGTGAALALLAAVLLATVVPSGRKAS